MKVPAFLRPTGRLSRLGYWVRVIGILVAFSLVLAISGITLSDMGRVRPEFGTAQFSVGLLIALISGFATFVFLVVTGIRRLHDRNRSGWWLLLFWAVPNWLNGVAGDTYASAPDTLFEGALALVAAGLSLWGMVEMAFLRGTKGGNRFGHDPLAKPTH